MCRVRRVSRWAHEIGDFLRRTQQYGWRNMASMLVPTLLHLGYCFSDDLIDLETTRYRDNRVAALTRVLVAISCRESATQ